MPPAELLVIEILDQQVDQLAALHSKLVLLIGKPGSGKSALLRDLGLRRGVTPLLVGSALGSSLAALPQKQRRLHANDILRELADERTVGDLVLLDNLELFFDRTLALAPLDLLKRLARSRRVVATWPGQLRNGRLTYAEIGHPEHQDYGLEGLVPFVTQ